MAVLGVRQEMGTVLEGGRTTSRAAPVGPPANAEDALGLPAPAVYFSGCEGPGRRSAWDHAGGQDADAAPAACPKALAGVP